MAVPNTRRPGVDADIVQANTVRGYDSPLAATPAGDLVLSTGRNQVTGQVSEIAVWNRTDQIQKPLLVLRPGAVFNASPRFEVFAGSTPDPNGLITAAAGSLFLSNNPPSTWQNQDGGGTWVKISDDLGGENLAETLAIGNFTGGNDILFTAGDRLVGESNALGAGGDLLLVPGASTGGVGSGGSLVATTGTSVGGSTGRVELSTAASTGANSSGLVAFRTGASQGGAASGNVSLVTGDAGSVGVGGSSGSIFLQGGTSEATGPVTSRGGQLFLSAGRGRTDGEGGSVRISAGNSSNVAFPIIIPAPQVGLGGNVSIAAGFSAGSKTGGFVSLAAGTGGAGGGAGGSIFLNPGAGGGGGPAGRIIGSGIFTSTNYLRGSGNPNGVVPGDEGYVYQREDPGQGEIWLNRNGSINGWVQLAMSGSIINALTRAQYGFLVPAGVSRLPDTNTDQMAMVGLYQGLRSVAAGGSILTVGGSTGFGGPFINLDFSSAPGDRLTLEMTSGTTNPTLALEHEFVKVFKFKITGPDANLRMFMGVSALPGATQLASDTPVGNYIGLVHPVGTPNWFFVNRGVGGFNLVDSGVSLVTTTGGGVGRPFYYIIDAREIADGRVRHFILDEDYNQLATFLAVTAGNQLPSVGTQMGPVMGGLNTNGATPAAMQFFLASLVLFGNDIDSLGGGGGGGGNQTLEQTLQFGNLTGILPILVSQGSFIGGQPDGDGGNGSPLLLFSGGTTNVNLNTGGATLSTANLAINATTGSTGNALVRSGSQSGVASAGDTGTVQVGSGEIIDPGSTGSTGNVSLSTGNHAGAGGATGAIAIATGMHTGVGGTTGDILIAPGTFLPSPSIPGLLDIRGGSTSLAATPGGSISILTGQSTTSGSTGTLTLRTPNVPATGNGGLIVIEAGNGGAANGAGGSVGISAGDGLSGGPGALGGIITLIAGDGSITGGGIVLLAGDSGTGNGANITLTAGAGPAAVGGDIILNPGSGLTPGEVVINGKLTVTGLIDPTGMLFDGQAVEPATPAAGEGLLWVDNTVVPSRMMFTDDSGATINLGSGGATALSALTDVSIAGPVIGEVLTYNGVQWQNLAGAGGSPLSTILALGNTTGANNLIVNTGQNIAGQTDLALNPGAGAGDRVVLDGLRWPGADGLAGSVLTTDGAGNLSFVPGGGGNGITFAQAYTRLQTGMAVPVDSGLASAEAFGIFELGEENHAAVFFDVPGTPVGPKSQYGTGAVLNQDAGVFDTGYCTNVSRRSLTTFKISTPSTANAHRLFAGLTNATVPSLLDAQLVSDNPGVVHVGLAFSSDLLDTTYRFVIDPTGGAFVSAPSTVAAAAQNLHVEVDLVSTGEAKIRVLDTNGIELDSHTFVLAIDPLKDLAPVYGVRARAVAETRIDLYSVVIVNQAYLIGGIGGGGTQNLSQVLFFGNQTGGQTIQGDNNALGSAGDLDLEGGSSTGAGGNGGAVNIRGGAPDPGGSGDGGSIQLLGANGAPGGDGSSVIIAAGNGNGAGDGGDLLVSTGNAQTGNPGTVLVVTGSASGGNASGGNISFVTGAGIGTGFGGSVAINTGAGGAGGGDGGSLVINLGAGGGGGAAGRVTVNGEVHITGKLTVDGLIDPPGLVMTPSVGAPFTPAPGEGGIWVNLLGELIFTNSDGDLNLSNLAPTSGVFLDAFLLASYGFLSPGSTNGTPFSSGVLGGSATASLQSGATKTLSLDSEGPTLTLSTAAAANSHAIVGIEDNILSRNQQLRTRIKFQSTSGVHTDERIFVGLTTEMGTQIFADDPVFNEYVGLRKSLASGTYDFVARGPGGAIVPIVAWPIDTAVHYLDIDLSDTNQVRFILYAADSTTVQATTTVLTSPNIPALTTGMQLAAGVGTSAGAVRSFDFYYGSVVTRADLVNAILGGGSGAPATLAATLLLGNTTGASNIVVSTGQGIFGQTDLVLSPGAGGADRVVLDGLRWPGADGGAGTFLQTNGSGVLTFASVPADSLQNVLAAGNTTGANNIIVTTGQQIQGEANLVLNPGPNPAHVVVIDGLSWPTSDGSSGQFLRTNGTGTLSFASVPADALSAVLAAGNTTGANDIIVTSPRTIFGEAHLNLSGGQTGGAGSPATGVLNRNATDIGGNVVFSAGSGGNSGSGGDITLSAGAGGAANGAGGAVEIAGGQRGGSGTSGTVLIRSGVGALPTAMTVISGASSTTGQIQLYGNTSTNTGGGLLLGRGSELVNQGGYALLMGGTGLVGGTIGGQAAVLGGAGPTGGQVTLRGGSGSTAAGGAITITGGSSSASVGGGVTINGGTGAASGGSVVIQGGLGFPPGSLTLLGGNALAGSGGAGGSVNIRPGSPDGAGSVGLLQLGPNAGTAGRTQIQGSMQKGTGIQAGSVTFGAAATSTTVTFTPNMATTPIVTVTPVFATTPAASYWVDAIGTTQFTLRRSVNTDGVIVVNWIAISTP